MSQLILTLSIVARRITPEGIPLSLDLPISTQQELGITKLIAGIDLPKLLAGLEIIAPTRAGTAIASGNLTNGGSVVFEGTGFNPTSSSLTNAALPATKKVVNIFGYFLVERIYTNSQKYDYTFVN